MNVQRLNDFIDWITQDSGEGIELHPTKTVVIKTADGIWRELDSVAVAFVNGRFVLQLTAGERNGVKGMHW